MAFVAVGIALPCLVAIVGVIVWLGKGLEPPLRTQVRRRLVVLAVIIAGGLTAAMYAQVYYSIPVAVVLAVLAIWISAGLVALDVVRFVGRTWGTYLSLIGLFIAVAVLSAIVMMFAPFGAPTGMFLVRAQQIAEANGFTALVPEGEEMVTDYLPVDVAGTNKDVLVVQYPDFELRERKAEGEASEAALRALLAPGARPFDDETIPPDAEITVLEVAGDPAVGVTFTAVPPDVVEKNSQAAKSETVTMLVLVTDGVDVRLRSISTMRYTGRGTAETYERQAALTVAELAEIAAKLTPVE